MEKTALYDRHVSLNARLVPFAGYEMPVQYSGIVQEHQAVRTAAGLFDVSHMGEFFVSGERAGKFLNLVSVNDVAALQAGQAQYTAMCHEDGGIVDDMLIYKYDDHYMVVVNASNIDKDFQWMQQHLLPGVALGNRSAAISLIAFQGPKSRALLQQICDIDLKAIEFYHFAAGTIAGRQFTVARTGYTGELGFEIYGSPADIPLVWDKILELGEPEGVLPVGLGARDTLRLEMKYCLYGNDIDRTTNPIEAGLGWIVKLDKDDFIGKAAVVAAKENIERRLVCLEMQERAVPRHGYKVFSGGEEIGYITSGTQSPSLNVGIALGYLAKGFTKAGTEVTVEIRGKFKSALVVKPPFYKAGTAQV